MSLKKPGRFRNSLAFRLTLWYAGMFAASSFVAFFLFYTLITSVIQEKTDQELLNQAGQFSTVLRERGIGAVDIPQHGLGMPDQLPSARGLAGVDPAELAG